MLNSRAQLRRGEELKPWEEVAWGQQTYPEES
jgi:hypothetical protein